MFLLSSDFAELTFSKNYFKNAIGVKWFGSRSGLTFCTSRSWSEMFANVIRKRQTLTALQKEEVSVSFISSLHAARVIFHAFFSKFYFLKAQKLKI